VARVVQRRVLRLGAWHYTARMKEITQRQLRNACGATMDAVERGEVFLVARRGRVVAELRPANHGAFVRSREAKSAFA
jgi:antitoxin (DNA-binding transcriptional repressor) of toxin-antitoxin stability system